MEPVLLFKNNAIVLIFNPESQKVKPDTGLQRPAYLMQGFYVKFLPLRRWYQIDPGYCYRVRSAAIRDYLDKIAEGEPSGNK